jgi:2-haloalkanoic acid dehalogenase type II
MSRYSGVLFDLLTGLLDSWTLWNSIAEDEQSGMRWRSTYIELTYRAGGYVPYMEMLAQAAVKVGLSPMLAQKLAERYPELQAWPEVGDVLRELRHRDVRIGVVTNCSEELGTLAAACVGVPFDVVMTAERAGFYKPHEKAYKAALYELGCSASETLFVAGSSRDVAGAGRVGLATFWHNRIGLPLPADAESYTPVAHCRSLSPLIDIVVSPGRLSRE